MKHEERTLWQWLDGAMGSNWMANRVENEAGAHIPDVYFTALPLHGWIELKVIGNWATRDTTPFRVEHWTPGQRNWMQNHREWGGNSWLLVQVKATDDLVILSNRVALDVVDKWSTLRVKTSPYVTKRRGCGAGKILAALGVGVV